jgi:hypothetical protein
VLPWRGAPQGGHVWLRDRLVRVGDLVIKLVMDGQMRLREAHHMCGGLSTHF